MNRQNPGRMEFSSVLADKKSLHPTLLSLSILNSLAKEPRKTKIVERNGNTPTTYRVIRKDELDKIAHAYERTMDKQIDTRQIANFYSVQSTEYLETRFQIFQFSHARAPEKDVFSMGFVRGQVPLTTKRGPTVNGAFVQVQYFYGVLWVGSVRSGFVHQLQT
jgi:hypothetical protein